MNPIAFIMGRSHRLVPVDPETIAIVGLLFALAAAVSAWIGCASRCKNRENPRLSSTFWYLAGTAVGLFMVYVVLIWFPDDGPME